jgi:threonine dehydratase
VSPNATPPPLEIARAELEAAAQRVHAVLAPTPLYAWPKLRARTGASVWVKHENHTPTGAFKVRGGLIYMERLTRREPGTRHVITATRGNHGQSVAFAAARAGLSATVYVPIGNSIDQNASMRGWGARVIETGRDFDEASQAAERASSSEGLHRIPSFHRDLVIGVATYALELFAVAVEFDTVYVGIGMGSGICGLITVRDLLGLSTEIVGVSAQNAPASARSFAARRPVPTDSARTFADGIATRRPDPAAIEVICRGASRIVEVSEDEMAEAVRAYFDDTHQVVEGAGAAPLAALQKERDRMAGKTVGLILSGGNIERARFLELLAGTTPPA